MTLIKTYFTEKFIQNLRISELLFNLYKRYLRFHDKIYRDFIIKFVSTIDCVVSVETHWVEWLQQDSTPQPLSS